MISNNPLPDAIVKLIQARALGIHSPEVFGSGEDLEQVGYETLLPSYFKAVVPEGQPLIRIGGPACSQPYDASLYNCSALSFGPMSKQFILAMNRAARTCGYFQNSGEAGLSPYHFGVDVDIEDPGFQADDFFVWLSTQTHLLSQGGDLVWQIGTGYFGCRRPDGSFDPDRFWLKAMLPSVKMIEIKLSQGVVPCKEMPVKQVTPGIAKLMGIQHSDEACLQDGHNRFSNPIELLHFVQELRQLSGGKPVGIKLGITHKHWFFAICKAMLQTRIMPDFITVDGMEAGTSAVTQGAAGYTGTTLNESVVFVHNALVGTNLREHIRIIASGQVFTEREMISKLARGADLCATARGMLLAVGCDQQRECNKGLCRQGIATQDPNLMANFDVEINTRRLINFHSVTIQEFKELLSIAGLSHPSELGPGYVQRRVGPCEFKTLDELYPFVLPGSLLTHLPWRFPKSFRSHWNLAQADTPFTQQLQVLSLHRPVSSAYANHGHNGMPLDVESDIQFVLLNLNQFIKFLGNGVRDKLGVKSGSD